MCVGAFFHQHKHIHHFFWPKCYSNGTIRKPKKRMGAKEKRVRQKHNFHTHFLGRLVTYTHRKTNSTEQRRKKISIAWYLLTGIDSAFMPLHHKPKVKNYRFGSNRVRTLNFLFASFSLFLALCSLQLALLGEFLCVQNFRVRLSGIYFNAAVDAKMKTKRANRKEWKKNKNAVTYLSSPRLRKRMPECWCWCECVCKCMDVGLLHFAYAICL